MATHIGNEGFVKLGNTTIGEIRSFELTETVNLVDDSALTDAADTHLVGSKNFEGTVTVAYDITDASQAAMTAGAEAAYTFLPSGNVASQPSLTGNATVESIAFSSSRNEMIEQTFTLKGQGALTRGTV